MNTRKRLRLETPHRETAEAPAISTLTETLQAVIQEVRLLRVEQARREEEYTATIRRQEEELHRLRGTDPNDNRQLSPSIIRASGYVGSRGAGGVGPRVASGGGPRVVRGEGAIVSGACEDDVRPFDGSAIAGDVATGAGNGLGYKLKPDTYDGTVPLQEYFSQFNLIARANFWDDAIKTVALASSLRGKARTVLETVQNIESLNFTELKSKLELRFGEGRLMQNYYSALTNRRQRFGEDLAALGSDIERLSRLAYPECPHEVRDKIACAQYVTAITDHFIRRALQMEGITSLYQAVERAKALKIIQGEGYGREKLNKNFAKEGQSGGETNVKGEVEGNKEQGAKGKFERRNGRGSKFGAARGECWTCGKSGHFRSECPGQRGNAN